MSERVKVTRSGGVAHVQLNRPDKKNQIEAVMAKLERRPAQFQDPDPLR